jgi:uncharacterized protein YecT (DUF1311 family)
MQLDLATMSGRELRSLLNSARERGAAQQSYAILQELARRREEQGSEAKPRVRRDRRRVADEPRIIEIDLGDPLAAREDDGFDLPEPPAAVEPTPLDAPLTLAAETHARERAPRRPPPAPKPPREPRPRPRRAPMGFFLAGAALGLGLGAAGGFVGAVASLPAAAPRGELGPIGVAETPPPPVGALAPPPAPVVAQPAPPPETPAVDPAAAPPDGLQLAVVSPDAADLVAQDAAAAEPTLRPEPAPAKAEPREEPCDAGAPADRVICRDPELQRLQKDLRRAYAEALDAHADRATLRQRQLAWREARNAVDDPERLAALYAQRIRKLEAATADARAAR